jgi:hypothetical protein
MCAGQSPLLELALLYISDLRPTISDADRDELKRAIAGYLTGGLDLPSVAAIFQARANSTGPVEKIAEILSVSDDPLPSRPETGECGSRRRTHPWSLIEDSRLLAAIHRFGPDRWGVIAEFVGNSRTRSQCSQRWQRGLDPRISKTHWSKQEEDELLRLVALYGERSWIRVSNALGNRSDVQCRYRFRQIQRANRARVRESPASEDSPKEAEPPIHVRPAQKEAREDVELSLEDIFAFNALTDFGGDSSGDTWLRW